MPGTAISAPICSSRTARASACGRSPESRASANLGPTPLTAIKRSNRRSSSTSEKPKRVSASSRTTWRVRRNTSLPRSAKVPAGWPRPWTKYPHPALHGRNHEPTTHVAEDQRGAHALVVEGLFHRDAIGAMVVHDLPRPLGDRGDAMGEILARGRQHVAVNERLVDVPGSLHHAV